MKSGGLFITGGGFTASHVPEKRYCMKLNGSCPMKEMQNEMTFEI
jgi:hypothetical protein